MRLTGAFLANKAEIVDDMLNVEGGFWTSTTVAKGSVGIRCNCVLLCDTQPDDIGQQFGLRIDAAGPSGQVWTPAYEKNFDLTTPMKFIVATQIALPIEPKGGRHIYSFRMEGHHERIDVPLDVFVH
jgi:hypothetical protein